jgi:uncharacterized protein
MQTITHEEMESALTGCGASMGAAEAHGALCGAIASAKAFRLEPWRDGVLVDAVDGEPQAVARRLLAALADETLEELTGGEGALTPLLPDDDVRLEDRTIAMAGWCSGFLHGLADAMAGRDEWPDSVREIVEDYVEIARASVGEEDSEEVNESSYTELLEYLRASAQLVYEELVAERTGE